MKTRLLANLSLMAVVIFGVLGLFACTMPFGPSSPATSSTTSIKVPTSRAGTQSGFLFVANKGGNSLSVFSIEPSTGELTAVGDPIAQPDQPVRVTVDPSRPAVYVTNNGGATGSVTGYALNETTGALTPVGAPISAGEVPLGIAVYPGQYVYAVNNVQSQGSVTAYKINGATGALAAVSGSPFAAQTWPGGIAVYVGGHAAYVTNYTSQTISAYSIDPTGGGLSPVTGSLATSSYVSPAGPRNLAIYEPGPFVYVVNGGSVSAYEINAASGALSPAGPSLAESSYLSGTGDGSYDVAVCTSAGYVYVSNPKDDTVTAYSIEKTTGTLVPIHGTTADSTYSTGANPRGLSVYEPGPYLYVTNADDATVSAFAVDPVSGDLHPVTGSLATSSYATGQAPYGAAVFFSAAVNQ